MESVIKGTSSTALATKYRKPIAFAILIVSTWWLFSYIRGHFAEFSIIFDLSLQAVIVLLALHFAGSVGLGLFNKVLLESLDVSLKWKEWYGLSVVSTFWNYLMPFRGGAGVRALYLKRVHGFTITSFLGTMAALYFIHFLVNSLIGLVCVLCIYARYQYLNPSISIFFFVVFLTVIFFVFFSPHLPESRNEIVKKVYGVVNGWYVIRKDTKLVLKLTAIVVLNAIFGLLTIYISFKAYGINLSLLKSTLISTLFSFSTLINITPGSLGITEAIMVLSANIFNITPAESLVAAGLIRVTNLCLVFTMGPILSYVLSLKVYKKEGVNGD